MRYNIAYKVVAKRPSGFFSTNDLGNLTSFSPSLMKLEYGIGITTIPVCGKIFIFNDESDALRYAQGFGIHQTAVIKGIAKNKQKMTYYNVLSLSSFNKVCEFWSDLNNGSVNRWNYTFWGTPRNTYLCDSFKGIAMVRE